MAKLISTKPAILLEQLRQLKAGLVKYTVEYTPASPSEADLDGAITALEGATQSKQDAAGAAEAATQALYSARDSAVDVAGVCGMLFMLISENAMLASWSLEWTRSQIG